MCTSELLPHEDVERLNDVKFLVQQLYTTLRIEEHQLSKERELIGRLEDLNSQLRPLEKVLTLLLTFFVVGYTSSLPLLDRPTYSHVQKLVPPLLVVCFFCVKT